MSQEVRKHREYSQGQVLAGNPPNSLWFAFPWVLFHWPNMVGGTQTFGLSREPRSTCVWLLQRCQVLNEEPSAPLDVQYPQQFGWEMWVGPVTCGFTLTAFCIALSQQLPEGPQVQNGRGTRWPTSLGHLTLCQLVSRVKLVNWYEELHKLGSVL